MNRVVWGKSALLLAALCALDGCGKPFDYDTASDAERTAWMEARTKGMADGLVDSLPRGANGIYSKIDSTSFDIARRRIEVTALISFDNQGTIPPGISAKITKGICPIYLRSELAPAKVTAYIRFKLDGGGTLAATLMTPQTCAAQPG